jgi:hypothetical protein
VLTLTTGIKYKMMPVYIVTENDNGSEVHFGFYQEDYVDGAGETHIVFMQEMPPLGLGAAMSDNEAVHAAANKAAAEQADADAKVAQKQAVADEVADFKAKAMAEAEAARKAAAGMQGNVDGGGSGGSSSIMGLISLATTILMIVVGLLVTRGPVSAKMPASIGAPLNKLLEKVSPLAAVLGLVLLGLGLFGAVMNILSFSILGLIFSLVAAAAGLLLGMDKLLNFDPHTFKGSKEKAEKIKAQLQQNEDRIRVLQDYRLPIGFASLVIGALMILGIF